MRRHVVYLCHTLLLEKGVSPRLNRPRFAGNMGFGEEVAGELLRWDARLFAVWQRHSAESITTFLRKARRDQPATFLNGFIAATASRSTRLFISSSAWPFTLIHLI